MIPQITWTTVPYINTSSTISITIPQYYQYLYNTAAINQYPPLVCEICGQKSAKERNDPYELRVSEKVLIAELCDKCYNQLNNAATLELGEE